MAAVDTLTARLVSGHELVPSWNFVGALVAVACAGLATPVNVARCGRCDVPHRTRTALWLACVWCGCFILAQARFRFILAQARFRLAVLAVPMETPQSPPPSENSPSGTTTIRGPPPRFRRPHHLRSLRTLGSRPGRYHCSGPSTSTSWTTCAKPRAPRWL